MSFGRPCGVKTHSAGKSSSARSHTCSFLSGCSIATNAPAVAPLGRAPFEGSRSPINLRRTNRVTSGSRWSARRRFSQTEIYK